MIALEVGALAGDEVAASGFRDAAGDLGLAGARGAVEEQAAGGSGIAAGEHADLDDDGIFDRRLEHDLVRDLPEFGFGGDMALWHDLGEEDFAGEAHVGRRGGLQDGGRHGILYDTGHAASALPIGAPSHQGGNPSILRAGSTVLRSRIKPLKISVRALRSGSSTLILVLKRLRMASSI